jgi:hypothetical protein
MPGIIPKRASNRQIIDNPSRQRYLSIPSPRRLSRRVTPSVPPLSLPAAATDPRTPPVHSIHD